MLQAVFQDVDELKDTNLGQDSGVTDGAAR